MAGVWRVQEQWDFLRSLASLFMGSLPQGGQTSFLMAQGSQVCGQKLPDVSGLGSELAQHQFCHIVAKASHRQAQVHGGRRLTTQGVSLPAGLRSQGHERRTAGLGERTRLLLDDQQRQGSEKTAHLDAPEGGGGGSTELALQAGRESSGHGGQTGHVKQQQAQAGFRMGARCVRDGEVFDV